jgi:hypothetical protein
LKASAWTCGSTPGWSPAAVSPQLLSPSMLNPLETNRAGLGEQSPTVFLATIVLWRVTLAAALLLLSKMPAPPGAPVGGPAVLPTIVTLLRLAGLLV